LINNDFILRELVDFQTEATGDGSHGPTLEWCEPSIVKASETPEGNVVHDLTENVRHMGQQPQVTRLNQQDDEDLKEAGRKGSEREVKLVVVQGYVLDLLHAFI